MVSSRFLAPINDLLLSWLMIGITYLRFCRHIPSCSSPTMTSFTDYGLKTQGTDRQSVYYRSRFQPFAGMYVVFWYVYACYLHALRVTLPAGRSFSSLLAVYRYFGTSTALTSLRHVSMRPASGPNRTTNNLSPRLPRYRFADLWFVL